MPYMPYATAFSLVDQHGQTEIGHSNGIKGLKPANLRNHRAVTSEVMFRCRQDKKSIYCSNDHCIIRWSLLANIRSPVGY